MPENSFLFSKPQKIKDFKPTVAYFYGDVFGFDLADYSKENGGNKGFIVVVVDYFTRFAWTRVISDKSKAKIHAALESIFDEAGKRPVNLHTDRESGLIHDAELKDVNVYHTDGLYGQGGAPIVERLIRTLREKLEQYRDLSTARQWKKHVPKVTLDYNNASHRTLGMSPAEAKNSPEDTKRIQEEIANRKPSKSKQTFEKGEEVITSKDKKNIFEKGFRKKYNENVLKINQIFAGGGPPTYMLSDGKKYYREQIKSITLPQKQFLTKNNNNTKATTNLKPIVTRSTNAPKMQLRSGRRV